MPLRKIHPDWCRNPVILLQECPILGFGDSVEDLYAFLAEDTQWNAFEIYDQSRTSSKCGVRNLDTLKAAEKELRHPSKMYGYDGSDADTSDWTAKEWKVLYIVTIITRNLEGRWAGAVLRDIHALAHGTLCLMVFMMTAKLHPTRAHYARIMKLREQGQQRAADLDDSIDDERPRSSAKKSRAPRPARKFEVQNRQPVSQLTENKFSWRRVIAFLVVLLLLLLIYGIWILLPIGSFRENFRNWLHEFAENAFATQEKLLV